MDIQYEKMPKYYKATIFCHLRFSSCFFWKPTLQAILLISHSVCINAADLHDNLLLSELQNSQKMSHSLKYPQTLLA